MSKTDRLIFTLSVGDDRRRVYPRHGADIQVERTRETGEQFLRNTLSGKLTFVGKDTDYILSQPFDTVYGIEIADVDTGAVYFSGHFVMADCTVDVDSNTVETTLTSDDGYNDILDGMTTTINVAKTAIPIAEVNVPRASTLQIYVYGSNVITNSTTGVNVESEIDTSLATHSNLRKKYGFFQSVAAIIKITRCNKVPELIGTYAGMTTGMHKHTYMMSEGPIEENSSYAFLERIDGKPMPDGYSIDIYNGIEGLFWDIEVKQGNNTIFKGYTNLGSLFPSSGRIYTAATDLSNYLAFTAERDFVYTRLLTDDASVEIGYPEKYSAVKISSDDISPRNYLYRVPVVNNNIYPSTETSDTTTEWGLAPSGGYYLPPPYLPIYTAIDRLMWGNISLWLYPDLSLYSTGSTNVVFRDCYLLSDVIAALLAVVAPDVTHRGTPEYSHFLYESMSPVADVALRLLVTQKSNVLKLRYTEAATNAPITLQSVLDMLKNVLRCYWWVDEQRRLRIEHISYFNSGGSYDTTPAVGIDLTRMYNTRNGKALAFGQNKYTYEKRDLPQRYEFGWADEVSDAFTGKPIEVLSLNVSKGSVEKVSAGDFTSDVALMMSAPDDFSMDGFALLGCFEENNSTKVLPSIEMLTETKPVLSTPIELDARQYSIIEGLITIAAGNNVNRVAFASLDDDGNVYVKGEPIELTATETRFKVAMLMRNIYSPDDEDESGTVTPAEAPPKTPRIALVPYNELTRISVVNMRLAITSITRLTVPEVVSADRTTRMVNGFLAFEWLQPNVWTYDMPARRLLVNGVEQDARSVARIRQQDIVFPQSRIPINLQEFIKTPLGEGQISKYTLNLLSKAATATLRYYETDK